jgi:hypothetical protein
VAPLLEPSSPCHVEVATTGVGAADVTGAREVVVVVAVDVVDVVVVDDEVVVAVDVRPMDFFGVAAAVDTESVCDAATRIVGVDRWATLTRGEIRFAVALTAVGGATEAGRLLMTTPVARPSVSTPVSAHETIARI